MEDKELRKQLDNIMKQVKDSKNHWRFNYSVSLNNGDCYGASFENETKNTCKEDKNGKNENEKRKTNR